MFRGFIRHAPYGVWWNAAQAEDEIDCHRELQRMFECYSKRRDLSRASKVVLPFPLKPYGSWVKK